MGEGGKERVTAEEGILGLDVRGKGVYSPQRRAIWSSGAVLGRSDRCGSLWCARVDTHHLLNRHYSPPVINIPCATLDMQPSGQLYPLTSALFLSSSRLRFVIDARFQRLLWNDTYARRILSVLLQMLHMTESRTNVRGLYFTPCNHTLV